MNQQIKLEMNPTLKKRRNERRNYNGKQIH